MLNEYQKFVKKHFHAIQKKHNASAPEVITIISKMWNNRSVKSSRTRLPVVNRRCADTDVTNCHRSGRICSQNVVRRSCRKPTNRR